MSLSAVALGIELSALMALKGDNEITPIKNKSYSSVRGRGNGSSCDLTRLDGSGFLLDLATCFYNRVMLLWNLKKTVVAPISLSSPEPLILPHKTKDKNKEIEGEVERKVIGYQAEAGRTDGYDDEQELSVCVPSRVETILKKVDDRWERGSEGGSDSNAANADVIDPLAYKIPCPRSSGGQHETKNVPFFFYFLSFLFYRYRDLEISCVV